MHSGTTQIERDAAAGLEASIAAATQGLLSYRQPDGHWVFELEADCTIPAEYVLLRHYLGEPVDAVLEGKIANYLRRVQGAHGGWALVHDGEFEMSASVKAYFALKMTGDSVDAPHMARAREAIRSRGGAIYSNVFTRFLLAMFGVTTWRSVPVLPVEIMLLPMWSPFHLNKISYWARTTIVPLMVLAALQMLPQELLDAAKVDGASPWQLEDLQHVAGLFGETLAQLVTLNDAHSALGTIQIGESWPRKTEQPDEGGHCS